MQRISVATVIVAVCLFGAHRQVAAQSLLQRLEQRLAQPVTPQPLPQPQPLPEPPPSAEANSDSAMLGVRVAPVTSAAVRQFGLAVRRGALITHIDAGSPADQVGLPLGGVIVAMNGQLIDAPEDLVRFVRSARPAQQVELAYYQRNRLFRKTVRLAQTAPLPQRGNPPGDNPPGGNAPGGNAPDNSVTAPRGQPADAPRPSLERQLGAGGERRLLGRIGRAIDQIVAPQGEPLPATDPRSRAEPEVVALRKQVELLQAQVQELRRRLAEVEKKLAADP